MGQNERTLLTAAGIGAVAGMRSMLAPALVSRWLSGTGQPAVTHPDARVARLLGSRRSARLFALLALGELAADKSRWIPARTRPLPLLGRGLGAGLSAASLAREKQSGMALALVAASTALVTAAAGIRARSWATRQRALPVLLAGMLEDGLALALGAAVIRSARSLAAAPQPSLDR